VGSKKPNTAVLFTSALTYFFPDTQQFLDCFGGTPVFSQQRALGPWTPGLTQV
jgi:hypothetical protein